MAVKSISKNLLRITEKLDIKLSVNILDNQRNNSLYSMYYASPQYSYFIVDIKSFVGITYKEKNGVWDSSKRIKINNNNIYQLVAGLRRARNNIYHPELFIYEDSGDIFTNADIVKRQTVLINNLMDGQCIQIVPSVIYDTDEKALVGVLMYINRSEHCIDLSVDEFETLTYFFETFNLSLETQAVVNMFLIQQQQEKGFGSVDERPTNNNNEIQYKKEPNISKNNTKRVILFKDDSNVSKEEVKGCIVKNKRPKSLDDL